MQLGEGAKYTDFVGWSGSKGPAPFDGRANGYGYKAT